MTVGQASRGGSRDVHQCVCPACPCRHTSTPAEVMFLYEEVYAQQQYCQHGVRLKPGDTVMDVGGNIGIFAMLAAEVSGSVQAPTR